MTNYRNSARRRRVTRRNTAGDVAAGTATFLGGCLLFFLIFAAVFLLGGAVVWLAWNLGVVALVAACGGSVSKISFLVACFVSLAISILTQPFRSSTS